MAETPSPETAVHVAIRHWSSLTQLADFAAQGHGYGDSDGGFGVTYPGDLDEYAREVEGEHIEPGHVEVYGFWGPPHGYEVTVTEAFYLDTLAAVLAEAGHAAEASLVQSLLRADGTT
jgi:hypothetical protein